MIDKKLLEILACPVCKGDVEKKEGRILCLKCGRKYPIRDEIPVMLEEEAEREGRIQFTVSLFFRSFI